jgi:hypothetical protein
MSRILIGRVTQRMVLSFGAEQATDDTVLAQFPRWAASERDGTAPSRLSDKQRDILALLVTNAAGLWI